MSSMLLLFNHKIEIAMKPEKMEKEIPVGCTGEGKTSKIEGWRENKTKTDGKTCVHDGT